MTLRDVVYALVDDYYIIEPDDFSNPKCIDEVAFGDIGNTPMIKLRFLAEDETTIEGLVTHPIFYPLYGCEVYRLAVDDNVIEVWLNMSSVYRELYGKEVGE